MARARWPWRRRRAGSGLQTAARPACDSAPAARGGQAMTFLDNQWPLLIRYLDDGRIEIDNNLCENAIRPFDWAERHGCSPTRRPGPRRPRAWTA
ncbi:MAG: transposase [Hyphomicrobiaceae bacterium]